MDVYVGSVFAFGFNFVPVGWVACSGQTLSISGNEVLYSLIGTTYGGDGVNTFGVPDLRGRVPVGRGQGPGLQSYALGQSGGHSQISITASNLAAHTHPVSTPVNGVVQIPASNTTASTNNPSGANF